MSLAGIMLRGLVRVAATMVLVTVVSWLLAEAAPGTAAERAARAAGVLPADDSTVPARFRAEILAQVAAVHDLGEPLHTRLVHRVLGLLQGDLGLSWRDRAPVSGRAGRAMWPTVLLVLLALVTATLVGMAAALAMVMHAGRRLDVALSGLAALAFALPPVWLALLGLRVLAEGHPFRILPVDMSGSWPGSPAALVLPVVCLALAPAFVLARHARAALLHASQAPWAVAARARGASPGRVLVVHAARVVAIELLPLLAGLVAYLLGATMVMEAVFGIPGLGPLLIDASVRGDAPVITGVAVLAGSMVALASAVADVAQHAADPRLSRP